MVDTDAGGSVEARLSWDLASLIRGDVTATAPPRLHRGRPGSESQMAGSGLPGPSTATVQAHPPAENFVQRWEVGEVSLHHEEDRPVQLEVALR